MSLVALTLKLYQTFVWPTIRKMLQFSGTSFGKRRALAIANSLLCKKNAMDLCLYLLNRTGRKI